MSSILAACRFTRLRPKALYGLLSLASERGHPNICDPRNAPRRCRNVPRQRNLRGSIDRRLPETPDAFDPRALLVRDVPTDQKIHNRWVPFERIRRTLIIAAQVAPG